MFRQECRRDKIMWEKVRMNGGAAFCGILLLNICAVFPFSFLSKFFRGLPTPHNKGKEDYMMMTTLSFD